MASSPASVQRIILFLHRLETLPMARSTAFEVHGIVRSFSADSANRRTDGSHFRRNEVERSQPSSLR